MGFKANFCCFCCCGMKPKKFTKSVCILFIVLSILAAIMNIVNVSKVTGAAMATPVIGIILNLITILFSIFVYIKIGKNNWDIVRCYGMTCLIVNIISLIMVIVSLIFYLVAVGLLGSAVSNSTNDSGATGSVVGFLLVIAIVPYTITFLIYAWFIHLSYKVMKGSDYMEDKEEEKAEEKAERDAQKNNQAYPPQGYPQGGQPQGYPPQGYPPQNQGFQPTENKDLNKINNCLLYTSPSPRD